MHIFDIIFVISQAKKLKVHTPCHFWPATLVKGIQYCSCRKSPDRLQTWWLSHAYELSWEHWHMKGSSLEGLFAEVYVENSSLTWSKEKQSQGQPGHIFWLSQHWCHYWWKKLKNQEETLLISKICENFMNVHAVENWMKSYSKSWFYLTVSNKVVMKLVCLSGNWMRNPEHLNSGCCTGTTSMLPKNLYMLKGHQIGICTRSFYRKCSICLQLQVTLVMPRVPNCTCNKWRSFQKPICGYTRDLWMVAILRNEQSRTGLASGQILQSNKRSCNP